MPIENTGMTKPFLRVIEGGGDNHRQSTQPIAEMGWLIDVLCDLKNASQSKGFDEVTNEIEVAYQRVKFLLTYANE